MNYSHNITSTFYSNLKPIDHPLGIRIEVCEVTLMLYVDDIISFLKLRYIKKVKVTNVRGEIEKFNDNFNKDSCID